MMINNKKITKIMQVTEVTIIITLIITLAINLRQVMILT